MSLIQHVLYGPPVFDHLAFEKAYPLKDDGDLSKPETIIPDGSQVSRGFHQQYWSETKWKFTLEAAIALGSAVVISLVFRRIFGAWVINNEIFSFARNFSLILWPAFAFSLGVGSLKEAGIALGPACVTPFLFRYLYGAWLTNSIPWEAAALVRTCAVFFFTFRSLRLFSHAAKAGEAGDSERQLPGDIKKTLNKLFEGSPHSIDNLPVYPIKLSPDNFPKKDDEHFARHPIMKGLFEDGRPFIAMKVSCHLTEEMLDKRKPLSNEEEYFNFYRSNRDITELLVIHQVHKAGIFESSQFRADDGSTQEGKYSWSCAPSYFHYQGTRGRYLWNFNKEDDRFYPIFPQFLEFASIHPLTGEWRKDASQPRIAALQKLIRGGESLDDMSIPWKLGSGSR